MTWIDVLNNVLLHVVQVGAIVLIGYICNYLLARTKNEKVQETLLLIEEAAKRAVTVTTQTYVDEIKANGELTAETAEIAFNRALAEVHMTVNQDAIEIADKVTGDVQAYLRQLIEEQVKVQKDILFK